MANTQVSFTEKKSHSQIERTYSASIARLWGSEKHLMAARLPNFNFNLVALTPE